MGLESVMDTPHICKQEGVLGGHTEAIKDLKEYRDKQNGALLRLADRVDKVDARLDSMQWWLIGLMGGVIASLILLVVNILAKK